MVAAAWMIRARIGHLPPAIEPATTAALGPEIAECPAREIAGRQCPPGRSSAPYPRLIRRLSAADPRPAETAYPAVSGADGTCASTDWIAWTAPIRAADSAGITIFVFGLAANFESVSSWRIATSVGSGFWAVIAA